MTFIIPQKNRSIIARWDGSLEIVGKVDIPYNSKNVVTDNGFIVAICLGKEPKNFRLKIFDPDGKQLVRSTEHKFTCIAAKGNVVYEIVEILVCDNILRLVDDFSKIYKFDITERTNPRHTATKRLFFSPYPQGHLFYDHIYKVEINENTLARFSGSVQFGGTFRHISVKKGRDIASVIHAANPYRKRRKPMKAAGSG